jgi:hypothetical protein
VPFAPYKPSLYLPKGFVRKHSFGIGWGLKNNLFRVVHIGTAKVLKDPYLLKAVWSLGVTNRLSIDSKSFTNHGKRVCAFVRI